MTDNSSSSPADSAADRLEHLRGETQAVLRYLAEEFGKQLQFSDNELTQTQSLLKDAVDTLTACFSGIHDRLCEHPEYDVSAFAERQAGSDQGEPSMGSPEPPGSGSSELELLLNSAIRTLQFQDLTKQLIDHAMHRISAMREVLHEVQSASVTERQVSLDRVLDHLRESIERHVANIDEHKTNPVSQGHMRTGEIELF